MHVKRSSLRMYLVQFDNITIDRRMQRQHVDADSLASADNLRIWTETKQKTKKN